MYKIRFVIRNRPYKPGRCDEVLKWKPPHMNSIDFKLKIVKEEGTGILTRKVGHLYVGQLDPPFATLKVTKDVKHLDNKIVECKFVNNQWVVMRERTDKSFPNSFTTADAVWKTIRDPVTKEMLFKVLDRKRLQDDHDSEIMPPPKRVARYKEMDASQAERLGRSCLSVVPCSRSHARLRRNATMSHDFSCVQPAFIDL
ncbi:mRNA-capping enzyme [Eumeta japonica]|uniref:mRNA-capping enzyme n=1 Tax=Eumeta variegata TaxID=151549 RepID=A0A4C1WNQ6_EUMVA|nr:mRNA-capping enzyme [Eumeta japonica]